MVTRELLVKELWAHLGPTKCEDFDEAILKIQQVGSLRDFLKEFERLGNQMSGWRSKPLWEGSSQEIADGILQVFFDPVH